MHAAPRAAQYEAMTELPDPVDQDRDEVLTIGGWPWRPGTRQGVITIIAAIAIAAGVLTGLLVTRQHTAASHPAPPGSVGVHPPAPLGASDTSRQRTTLQGSPVTATTGVQLLISRHLGWPLAWFSLDSGTLTPLDLPPNAQLYRVQAFPGGVLLRPDTTPPCDGCPGPPAPVYYAASGSRTVTRVGFANWDAAVTADHATAWLSSYRPAFDPYSGRSQTFTAQKVDLSGHPLGPPTRLPSGYLPAGGWLAQPASTLLLQAWTHPNPTGEDYTLWDPSSRTVTASYGSVIAVSAHQIAWTASSCTEVTCPLHLTDPIAGTTSTQPLPPGQMPTLGCYSPDGHHLALLLTVPSGTNASPRRGRSARRGDAPTHGDPRHRAGHHSDTDLERRRPVASDHQPRSATGRARQPAHATPASGHTSQLTPRNVKQRMPGSAAESAHALADVRMSRRAKAEPART